eukprot:TRINITY_DN712_c0_g1_i1.p1 TRINITY_DN712_c0_g1~~TRINITY_DN712_c0_g1_i1.p1  ORF type:complete len:179 (-),score=20.25 TRINITY_DN712_c0_g1_i1:147-683(-)
MSESKKEAAPIGIYSLYIINKSGGLIYQKDFANVPKMDTNDYINLGSMFHATHVIINSVNPRPLKQVTSTESKESGSEFPESIAGTTSLELKHFRLECYQTPTGIKFFVTAPPTKKKKDEKKENARVLNLEAVLQTVYKLYTDYVLKNPFQQLEMPIRCDLFDDNLLQALQNMSSSSS